MINKNSDDIDSNMPPSILIVEDELLIAKGIQRCLRIHNYPDAHIAITGEKGLDKISDIHPDLVLMDIMLKGNMNGIETARKIRSLYDIPIIYLTSYSDKETLEMAKQTEPYGYILKPFEEKELISSIEIAICKHQLERRMRELHFSSQDDNIY